LSPAAISDDIFIETHDPNNQFRAMGRTLYEVVPGCLSQAFLEVISTRRLTRIRERRPPGLTIAHCRQRECVAIASGDA
jgi:hypothetical protein